MFNFFSILKNILFEMCSWCNSYINRVDKSVKVVTEDLLRWHAVFYSMCQALFYIISFRHEGLMDSKRSKLLQTFMVLSIPYSSSEYTVWLIETGQVSKSSPIDCVHCNNVCWPLFVSDFCLSLLSSY